MPYDAVLNSLYGPDYLGRRMESSRVSASSVFSPTRSERDTAAVEEFSGALVARELQEQAASGIAGAGAGGGINGHAQLSQQQQQLAAAAAALPMGSNLVQGHALRKLLQTSWVWDVAIFTYGSCVYPLPDITDVRQQAQAAHFINGGNLPAAVPSGSASGDDGLLRWRVDLLGYYAAFGLPRFKKNKLQGYRLRR